MDDKKEEEKLYREYDDPEAFKRLGIGFDEREQWRRTKKERLHMPGGGPSIFSTGEDILAQTENVTVYSQHPNT